MEGGEVDTPITTVETIITTNEDIGADDTIGEVVEAETISDEVSFSFTFCVYACQVECAAVRETPFVSVDPDMTL